MSTLKVNAIIDAAGGNTATINTYTPPAPVRAWVNFNGTGTVAINASYNVTDVDDNGTGDYTINFTNALPDANYSYVFGSSKASGEASGGVVTYIQGNTYSTNSLRLQNSASNVGTARDNQNINVAIFR